MNSAYNIDWEIKQVLAAIDYYSHFIIDHTQIGSEYEYELDLKIMELKNQLEELQQKRELPQEFRKWRMSYPN